MIKIGEIYNQLTTEDVFNLMNEYPNYFNIDYIKKLCEKLGYNYINTLDKGNSGIAYIINENKVLKITTDKTEFLVASKLKNKKLNRVSTIYNTYKIKNQDVYIIILELLKSLPENLFNLIEEFNGTNIKNKTNPKFDSLKKELEEIKNELMANGITKPSDYDWWMNMGLKNGKLSVFDVGDNTIDYNDFNSIDLSDIIHNDILTEAKNEFKKLKDNKVSLTDEERKQVMDADATWHHGPNGEPTPAVWKSKNKNGKITYITHTHRAYNTAPTLKGAIGKFHSFIKGTA